MPDTQSKKHAYLVMAHNNFSQLQTLLSLLDDPRNDIYLHVAKRAAALCPDALKTQHSKLIFVDRIRVNWGGHSQIACELMLLKAAAEKGYMYYHLLSGADLPIKPQREIHAFFDREFPHNFIEFDHKAMASGSFLDRIETYHFLHDYVGRNTGFPAGILRRLETASLWLQNRLGVKRRQFIPAYKGTNWFSITHELAQHVLTQEPLIKKQFYRTVCADEVFLHSIVMASSCRETVVDTCLREIDWVRGDPYVYRAEDVDALLRSENLFARKFDERIDRAAIEKLAAQFV